MKEYIVKLFDKSSYGIELVGNYRAHIKIPH